MLFTDAMPNVGRTDSAGFRALTQSYADRGIGLSAFGVGVDFGQELVYHISKLRGGNFFFLETPEKIAKVFDSEFDYLVTPLVYDLKVRIETPRGLKLKAVYGLPTWKPGSRDAELEIPTVFLSSNRGAIVLRYEREDATTLAMNSGGVIADGSISYTDLEGTSHSQQTELRTDVALRPGTQFFTHDGMRMAVALTNIYFGLRDACLLVTQGKNDSALVVIRQAKAAAALENLSLADSGISSELKLLDKLAENIKNGGAVRKDAGEGE
jgi:Ca-activated chloride channel family protein